MTTFHIETYGCTLNFADSEQMAGLLQKAQFIPARDIEEADFLILNSCTIKSPTETAFFKRLEEIKEKYPYKPVIIAGCIPQTDPGKLKNYSLVGTRSIHHIVEVVEETLHDNLVKVLETGEMPPLNLPKLRKNPIVEIIPVSRGCLSACTFCKIKQARGNLQSYPPSDITALAAAAVNQGVKELWLTSQDCFCYGFDLGTNLPALLKELIKIPGDFKIRIGMGSPAHLKKIKDELFPLLNGDKLFRFLHIPIQSGSNRILELMKRGNTKEEFLEIVRELKEKVPQLNLATDIIVGFPTEREEDYWETLNLAREITPDTINISRYWAREKTEATKMKQLPGEVVKHRSGVLTDIFGNISRMQNERWLGWKGEIIIDEEGKEEAGGRETEGKEVGGKETERKEIGGKEIERKGMEKKEFGEKGMGKQWLGRNSSYKPVIVRGDYKLGDVVKVRITKAGMFELRGETVGNTATK